MTESDAIGQGLVFLRAIAVVVAYVALIAGPIAAAMAATNHFLAFSPGDVSVVGVAVFVTLMLVFETAAVIFGHWIGMLDFEHATGRLGGQRQ